MSLQYRLRCLPVPERLRDAVTEDVVCHLGNSYHKQCHFIGFSRLRLPGWSFFFFFLPIGESLNDPSNQPRLIAAFYLMAGLLSLKDLIGSQDATVNECHMK